MRILVLLIVTNLTFFCHISNADTLIIDRITKEKGFTVPQRGLTMNQVIAKFGEPKQKYPAVGEPPITKWRYDKFTVYFERKWVIDSVVQKVDTLEKGPKPIHE